MELSVKSATSVAIIGAGPYGLSIAAHLRAAKISFRIFGRPMSSWQDHMPAGTTLKSLGFASNLYHPTAEFTLEAFCKEQGLPYDNASGSTPLERFVAYGQEFQRRFVPELEQTEIRHVEQSGDGFVLKTSEGEELFARRVILAVGITHFDHTPGVLRHLPTQLMTHSSRHNSVRDFQHRRVAVIGGGASATDLAGLLQEQGCEVHLVARRAAITFHAPTASERSLLDRVIKPRSGLGDGWRGRLCAEYPLAFHMLPVGMRHSAVRRVNGPAAVWHTKEKIVGKVAMHLSTRINAVAQTGGGVELELASEAGSKKLCVDHVIAATGYKVELSRLRFMHPALIERVRTVEDAPVLSRNFETSVAGLHMVGLASANSFGPLCRFACGARFTSRQLTRHLAATATN